MGRILILAPYFGELPASYKMWETTALANRDVDFLVISDTIRTQKISDNLSWHYQSFEDLRYILDIKYNARLRDPYKLCDYKPLMGDIWSDFTSSYDYWGHSDLDLIFGSMDLSGRIQREESIIKILDMGHLSIYKNSLNIPDLLLSVPQWKLIKETDIIWIFDENWGHELPSINVVLQQRGLKIDKSREGCFDILPEYRNMVIRVDNILRVVIVKISKTNSEILFFDGGTVRAKKVFYVHYQKRQVMPVYIKGCTYILPRSWEEIRSMDDLLKRLFEEHLNFSKNPGIIKKLRMRSIKRNLKMMSNINRIDVIKLLIKKILRLNESFTNQ